MTATTFSTSGIMKAGTLLTLALAACACGLDRQTAPSLVGPSGHALSLTLSASPDILPRDGSSQASVTVTAYDADGSPKRDLTLRVMLESTPTAGAGQVSVTE